MQGIEQAGFGVPHQGVGTVIELFAQCVERLVDGVGLVRFEAIELAWRALEVGRLAPIDLPATAGGFVQQDRVQAVGDQCLRGTDTGGAAPMMAIGFIATSLAGPGGFVLCLKPSSRASSHKGSVVDAALVRAAVPLWERACSR